MVRNIFIYFKNNLRAYMVRKIFIFKKKYIYVDKNIIFKFKKNETMNGRTNGVHS